MSKDVEQIYTQRKIYYSYYYCKYFNIGSDEETLEKFEKVFNNFSAAEQGKTLLKYEKRWTYSGK